MEEPSTHVRSEYLEESPSHSGRNIGNSNAHLSGTDNGAAGDAMSFQASDTARERSLDAPAA